MDVNCNVIHGSMKGYFMKKDFKKSLRLNLACLFGGVLAVFLGWTMSGWNKFSSYLESSPEKAIVWGVLGLVVGNVVGIILCKLDGTGRGEDGKSGEDK